MRSLAPIGVSTYSRINHLKQTIEALQKNTLAKESELYIFSDAPKLGDEEKIANVRDYIHTIDGFKTVNIFERTTNNQIKNNRGGVRELLEKYGRVIFMEDDNVTAPGFLQFMNDALDFYEDDKNIIAISGYNVPVNYPKSYKYDCYLSVYFNGWGVATWNDRNFLKITEYNDAYNEVMNNTSLYKKINKIHPKLINGLKQIQDGKLDAGDYKIVFHSIKNNLYTIKPIQSFVNNIGHDGSGVHCGLSNKFGMINSLRKEEVCFSKGVKYDFKIDQIFYKYFHPDSSEDLKMNLPGMHPKTLNFMVNDVCNSRCKMCQVWKQKREKEITPEELSSILHDPLFSNLRYVGLSGGEPTLRKDLPEIFRVIADKEGLKGTGLITNALNADHVIKQLIKCHEICREINLPFNVMVSLDGIGKVHDKVRGRKGNFENALRVIRYIRDNTHISLSVGCTVIKENVWHVDEVLDFCKRENVYGRFRIGEFINRLYNNDLKEDIRNFDDDERYQIALFFCKLELSYETSPNIKETYRNIRQMIFEGKLRESGCPYRSEAVGLDSRGNLLYCSPKSQILGSCLENSAKIIYEKNIPLRESIIQKYCSNCIHDYHAKPSTESLWKLAQEMLLRKKMSVRQSIINSTNIPASSPMTLQWSKLKNPLIVGWYGTETAGDKAIISDIIRRLKKANPQMQITIASLYPFVTTRTLYEIGEEDIRIVKTYSKEYIEACKSADAIVMGGGPLMGMEALGFVLTAFSEARKSNIPCIIEGCGVGPLIADEHILAVKEILRLSTQIRVRDKTSLSWVTESTGRIDASCTVDPATRFVEGWKKETLQNQTTHDEKYFACFLREITSEYANGMSSTDFLAFRERFEKELGEMICNIREKTGLKPLLMPMHTFAVGKDDRDFARKFAKTYLHEGDYDIVNKICSPQDILSVISRSKFNLCMRFHSVLFAEKLDVPFVAIDYTGGGKIKGYLKDKKKLEFIIDRAEISNEIWRQKINAILLKYDLRSMNVVHLCSQDFGGAGKATYRLHKGLQKLGIQSTMIVLNKKTEDPTVKVVTTSTSVVSTQGSTLKTSDSPVWRCQLKRWQRLISNYPERMKRLDMFTDAVSDVILSSMKEIQEADIIHLHWIAGMIDFSKDIYNLAEKPFVWTLHDMNPFTGGCHYTGNCKKYLKSCGMCQQLGSDTDDDLSRSIWNQKNNAYQKLKIHVVTPSHWLAKCVGESKLFSDLSLDIIPNGFPLDIFKPYSKLKIRKKLKILKSARVILFVADAISDERKGFKYLVQAIEKMDVDDKIIIALLGSLPDDVIIPAKYPVLKLGTITDEKQLVQIYSSADVFILPSLEDNLPNTMIEAMACGTPVVGFKVGGIPDAIEHRKNGYLVEPGSVDGLIKGIEWVISSIKNGVDFPALCREKVENEYSLENQAAKYKDLYDQVYKNKKLVKENDLITETWRQENKHQVNRNITKVNKKEFIITAIVSVYNAERFIHECLWDLEAQTISDKLEIIVIDSNSPQNEKDSIEHFQQLYDNIVYVRTEEREGLYAAWNRGIRMARGKYITNANTDDRHFPYALEVEAKTLDTFSNVGMVYPDVLSTSEEEDLCNIENLEEAKLTQVPDFTLINAMRGSIFSCHPMWRKSVHEEIGFFDESYRIAGDYEFFYRLARRFGAMHIRRALGLYLENQNGIEKSQPEITIQEFARLRKKFYSEISLEEFFPALSQYSSDTKAKAAALWELGNNCMKASLRPEFQLAMDYYSQARDILGDIPQMLHNMAFAQMGAGDMQGGFSLLTSLADKLTESGNMLQLIEQNNGKISQEELRIFIPEHPVLKSGRVGMGINVDMKDENTWSPSGIPTKAF